MLWKVANGLTKRAEDSKVRPSLIRKEAEWDSQEGDEAVLEGSDNVAVLHRGPWGLNTRSSSFTLQGSPGTGKET